MRASSVFILGLPAIFAFGGVWAGPAVGSDKTAIVNSRFLGGDEPVRSLLKKYCFECHDDATHQAKLSLESRSTKPEDFSLWIPVYDKLRSGQMPPKDALQPSVDERTRMAEALRRQLHAASLAQQRNEGRVTLRRLNLTEYETTLRDLLGKQVAVRDLLPPDTVAAGFDKISAVLDVSSVHLLRYQDAAEKALSSAIPRHEPAPIKTRLTGREIIEKSTQIKPGKIARVDGETLVLYAVPYAHIAIGSATVPQAGRYVLRASLSAVGTGPSPFPVRFSAGKPWGRNGNSVLAVRDVDLGKSSVVEFECDLERSDLVDVMGWSLPFERQFTDRKLAQGKPLEEFTGPGLAIEWIEIEGPIEPFPAQGYRNLFGDTPLKGRYKGDALRPESPDPRADAQRLMPLFLSRAFRRPVSAELVKYYVQIVHTALDQKQSFEQAMLLGYRAALCSPHFLYLTEPVPTNADQPAVLDDYAIAARLAYLFWSTLPDEELRQLASKGELTRPTVLRAQVERLLNDPRSSRFIEHFTGQWLDLRKINETVPSPQAYGEFDDFLFWSMSLETNQFFEEILRKNRSLTEFVHSDWSMLNQRLAQHYGIPGVAGGELRLVALPAASHRGGVITQASILKITADGTKTSPILRGKWVLEKILGQPPAPPPPNVAALEPDIRGATTIRQQLDKHRNIESCAACHRHIDPPGFALESFDVIGGWRDFYRATTYKRDAVVKLANYPGREVVRGLDVESNGTTAEGRSFQNIDEYKQLLLAKPDQLARNLTEKLLIYATGAEIQFADREVVEQLVAKSRANGFKFRSLIHEVVQCRIFLEK